MSKEEMERIILHRTDAEGMWVGKGVRLNVSRRYLEENPDSQNRVAKVARKLLGLTEGAQLEMAL